MALVWLVEVASVLKPANFATFFTDFNSLLIQPLIIGIFLDTQDQQNVTRNKNDTVLLDKNMMIQACKMTFIVQTKTSRT